MPTVAYRANRRNRKFVNAPKVKKEISNKIEGKSKKDLIALHEKRAVNWKNKPEFDARKFISLDSIKVNVFPVGENADIWRYVSEGTPPHAITGNPFLVFIAGSYSPKTRPGNVYGGAGTVTGGSFVRVQTVRHPGNEPRNFPFYIKIEYAPTFSDDMSNAFRRGIRG